MPERTAKIDTILKEKSSFQRFFRILIFSFCICFLANGIFSAERIEINTASLQQLDEIIGIGPALGQRIIDARPFSSLDDLLKVKGIGEKTLQKIKDQGLAYIENSAEATKTSESQELIESKPLLISYPDGIIFNEIMPSPEGADETEEWIELKNLNDKEISLSGWKIKDEIGSIKIYTLPADKKIQPNGFLILKRPETKIILNNEGDTLSLVQPDEKVLSIATYEKAVQGQSYIFANNSWAWSNIPTPGSENIISIALNDPGLIKNAPNKKISDQKASLGSSASVTSEKPTIQPREILNNHQEKDKKCYPIPIAIAISIFSAIIIYALKKSLKIDKN